MNDEIPITLTLYDVDFPKNYINQCHPTDYTLLNEPIIEHIYNTHDFHYRLLLRISFKVEGIEGVEGEQFIPITFVCDTGAPLYFYLAPKTLELLKFTGRYIIDEELGIKYITIISTGKKMPIHETPSHHPNINIMGLKALGRFKLRVDDESFSFDNLPDFL